MFILLKQFIGFATVIYDIDLLIHIFACIFYLPL